MTRFARTQGAFEGCVHGFGLRAQCNFEGQMLVLTHYARVSQKRCRFVDTPGTGAWESQTGVQSDRAVPISIADGATFCVSVVTMWQMFKYVSIIGTNYESLL
jgi:hypothetical protein